MPIACRWNNMRDAIQSYLENRGTVIHICQDHKSEIDNEIQRLINDFDITNNAMEFLARLNPVSIALDRAQSDSTTIAVAVEIWNKLETELDTNNQPLRVQKDFEKRRNRALSGAHFLANIIDDRFRGKNFSQEQRRKALEILDPNYMPIVTAILTQSKPFPPYLFGTQFRNSIPSLLRGGSSLI